MANIMNCEPVDAQRRILTLIAGVWLYCQWSAGQDIAEMIIVDEDVAAIRGGLEKFGFASAFTDEEIRDTLSSVIETARIFIDMSVYEDK